MLGFTIVQLGVLNGKVGDQNKFWFKMVMYWFKTFYLMSNMVELVSKTFQLWCQKQLSKLSWDLACLDPSHEMLGYRMIK